MEKIKEILQNNIDRERDSFFFLIIFFSLSRLIEFKNIKKKKENCLERENKFKKFFSSLHERYFMYVTISFHCEFFHKAIFFQSDSTNPNS